MSTATDNNITGDLVITDDVNVGGALTVVGASTFTGAQTFTGLLTANGGAKITGVEGVSGNLIIGGTVGIEGSALSEPIYAPLSVTGIVDNTITTVATITIPNTNVAAVFLVFGATTLRGANAYESTRSFAFMLVVARTTGTNAVVTIMPLELSGTNPVTNVNQLVFSAQATIAAGATITSTTPALGAVAGAVGAVNTCAIRFTNVASVAQVSQTVLNISGLNLVTGGITIA